MKEALQYRYPHQGQITKKLAFWTIRLMHDNPLLPYFKDPYNLLKAAGLRKGQKVVDVGCGPGYFTIAAAHIVGQEGLVYAIDINPFAVERVREKISKEAISNVVPLMANAANTGILEHSVDLAFMFGIRHIAGGIREALYEMHRILKIEGFLAFQKPGRAKRDLLRVMKEYGFDYRGRQPGILLFMKSYQDKRSGCENKQIAINDQGRG